MSKLTILLMTANSAGNPLALDQELRAIKEAMRRGKYRDAFDVQIAPAVRYGDLQGVLLEHEPHIVHFSGHGDTDGRLMLVKDASGDPQPVAIEAVARTFAILKDNIRVVVLNACFTEAQAKAIAKEIDCVVGTKREVLDTDAVEFASGFYEALGYGRSVETAFQMGRNRVQLSGSDQERLTRLFVRQGVDASALVLAAAGQAGTPAPTTPAQPGTAQPGSGQPGSGQPGSGQPAALPTRLSGPQYKALQSALLVSFTQDELAEIVRFDVGEELPNIVSSGDNKKVVFELIGWAQRTGKLPDLLRGALNAEPKRAEIEAFVKSLG